MAVMDYQRTKVAPWETVADGRWHAIRTGPADEPREESHRQHRRHYDSMRAWARTHGYQGQLRRREHGRLLSVRLVKDTASRRSIADKIGLRKKSPNEVEAALISAVKLISYALHLRQFGENAPGGDETWAEFDMQAEKYLRKMAGKGEA